MAQLVEHLPLNHEVMDSNPTYDKILSHVCAHFGIRGRCEIILSRLSWRWQLQYRAALIDSHYDARIDVRLLQPRTSLLRHKAMSEIYTPLTIQIKVKPFFETLSELKGWRSVSQSNQEADQF